VLVEQDPLLRKTELCYVYAIRSSAAAAGRLVRHDASRPHVPVHLPPDGVVLAPATLRAHLKARLPLYMVPAAFVRMDEFPLTPNGKIDRDALPAPSFERTGSAPAAAREADAGRTFTETETKLAGIWAELLNVKQIGVEDDFFDLGGGSLLAIRAVSRIRSAFGVDVQLRNLIERSTLTGLAEVIDALSWAARETVQPHHLGEREEIVL
ncbi:MAG TPA: phosphopantetheine-binding protein, partial [Gemmatimonadaceae bacterium]|nr:phosphopantetheine-binding protein [Gemmatimonadaceae bacterium]